MFCTIVLYSFEAILELMPISQLRFPYIVDRCTGPYKIGHIFSQLFFLPIIFFRLTIVQRCTRKILFLKCFPYLTRKGWCPRTGGGQRLMSRIAVNEDITGCLQQSGLRKGAVVSLLWHF